MTCCVENSCKNQYARPRPDFYAHATLAFSRTVKSIKHPEHSSRVNRIDALVSCHPLFCSTSTSSHDRNSTEANGDQSHEIFMYVKQFLHTGVLVAAVLTKWLHRESATRISMKPAEHDFSQSGRSYRALLRFRNKIPHKHMLYGLR